MNEQPDQQDKSESAEQPLRHGRRPHSRQEVFLGRGNAEPDKTKLQRGQRGGQPQGNETGFSDHFVPVSTLCVFSLYCLPSSSRGIDRKSVVQGKRVSVRVELGCRLLTQNIYNITYYPTLPTYS